ncbi:hypothetical protein QT979_20625 [Microcoleus sp. w2-18bC1]|uniref:hypothetical protein n=1 Tax=unclassified Microcoleus TaxID=2642155 RepID=UPI002FD00B71
MREYFGKFQCYSTIFVSKGSSATDYVTDVTDVTDVRKKEEGRRKKGEGKRKKEEGKLSGSLPLAANRDPEALPRWQKNRRQSNSEMRSQPEPGHEEKTTFYKICLLPKLIIHQRQKRP